MTHKKEAQKNMSFMEYFGWKNISISGRMYNAYLTSYEMGPSSFVSGNKNYGRERYKDRLK